MARESNTCRAKWRLSTHLRANEMYYGIYVCKINGLLSNGLEVGIRQEARVLGERAFFIEWATEKYENSSLLFAPWWHQSGRLFAHLVSSLCANMCTSAGAAYGGFYRIACKTRGRHRKSSSAAHPLLGGQAFCIHGAPPYRRVYVPKQPRGIVSAACRAHQARRP